MGASGIECLLVADAEAYHAWIAQVHILYLLEVGLLPGVEVFLGTGGGGTGHQIDEAVGVGVYFADAGFAGFGGNEHDDTDVILRGDGFVTLFVIAEREVGNDDAIDAAFHALLAEGFEAELHDGIEVPHKDEGDADIATDVAQLFEKQLSAQLLPNRKTAAQYRAAAEARQTLESRWQWVSALAATAGGTLTSKQKIRLEAYIQMNYLDRILRYANTRLMQMTAGQYELERIGAENQRSQSGLDLGVIDHYNGTRRSVKTLSGGESFKASLALALGLSDEVQSSAGGIRLDTLFLDEGFGSLDEESLELAIRVLSGLTEGDRLVGIISHVGALKDRIDRQVVVHKARTGGSTVELRV